MRCAANTMHRCSSPASARCSRCTSRAIRCVRRLMRRRATRSLRSCSSSTCWRRASGSRGGACSRCACRSAMPNATSSPRPWRNSWRAGARCCLLPESKPRMNTDIRVHPWFHCKNTPQGERVMRIVPGLKRRHVLLGSAGALFAPAIARAATRGVSDTEIVVGSMADLSGVTAVQGVNNADAMRMAFDEANAKGGVHGRKIRFVVEDNEYTVPKAVQAMNKLLNRDNIFFAVGNGGTPMNDATMPMMFEKDVPNVFPTTCARSMYEPFNKLKFGQFASYYDQMRAGVKYFADKHGKKRVGVMYEDTDFGRDVLAGGVAQTEAMGM